MMPSPVHVCSGLASPADAACCMYCEIVKSLATWQQRFDVDSNFLSYRGPLSVVQFRPTCDQCSSVGGSEYLHQMSSKSVQYSCGLTYLYLLLLLCFVYLLVK